MGLALKSEDIIAAEVDDTDVPLSQASHSCERHTVHPVRHYNVREELVDAIDALQNFQSQPVVRSHLRRISC